MEMIVAKSIGMAVVAFICVLIMKKVNPEGYKVYRVYVVIVVLLYILAKFFEDGV